MDEVSIPIDPEKILDSIPNSDIVEYLGKDEVLNEITVDEVAAYYDHGDLLAEIEYGTIVSESGVTELLDAMDSQDIYDWVGNQ